MLKINQYISTGNVKNVCFKESWSVLGWLLAYIF